MAFSSSGNPRLRSSRLCLGLLVAIAALFPSPPAIAAESSRVVLSVEGMVCPFCERSVQSTLTGLGGVESADADRHSQKVEVIYGESEVSPREMVRAVNVNTPYRAALAAEQSFEPARSDSLDPPPIVLVVLVLVVSSVVFLLRRGRRNPTGAPAKAHLVPPDGSSSQPRQAR